MTQPSASPLTTADMAAWADRLRQQGHVRVRQIETHISWLVMAADRVWKVKKPVRLPFVDFSTLALRRHFCEEELRLSRRLAPQIYRRVVPLWRDAHGVPDTHRLARPADEWAVEMLRFADDALLAQQVHAGQLAPTALHALGVQMARFHSATAAQCPDAHYGSADLIASDVRALFAPLCGGPFAERVPIWQEWVAQQVARLTPLWRQRHRQGFVREGHGDLHMGNLVVLDGRIVPFDCIEFDPAKRWIDPVNDIAFLTMDLQAAGHTGLAAQVQDGWLQQGGDFAGLATWRFYEVYRAMVRAMVTGLSPASGSDGTAPGAHYADLLDGWTGRSSRPQLAITCGLSGSGKSTIAAAWLAQGNAVRLRSDVERKRLFGLDALDDSQALGQSIYTEEATTKTFARLAQLAEQALRCGWSVVVDAAFLRQRQRAAFRLLAQRLQLPFTILWCEAPPEVLRQRIAKRRAQSQDPSEATPELVAAQQQWLEPFTDEERPFVQPTSTGA
ncbi:bifunctional aminoglycoside phosphotransferase/ATP-binding protein [Lampropedia cohaerens]|nr:bifunctional aminoglycoside phosphotransferase/ATP-binding protein [Lampropedia cohaerens]